MMVTRRRHQGYERGGDNSSVAGQKRGRRGGDRAQGLTEWEATTSVHDWGLFPAPPSSLLPFQPAFPQTDRIFLSREEGGGGRKGGKLIVAI